jgi:hypothetical protein
VRFKTSKLQNLDVIFYTLNIMNKTEPTKVTEEPVMSDIFSGSQIVKQVTTVSPAYNGWNFCSNLVSAIVGIFMLVAWLTGFVIAKGFWSTFACMFPFYAWYLTLEHFLVKYSLV